MGISDREYYRNEGPSFLGSFAERGQVCKWLIIINIGIYVLQLIVDNRPARLAGSEPLFQWLALSKDGVLHGEVWRLLTYAFLHSTSTWMHIAFNMLLLFFFGREMEELYGPREFLAFYLVAAVAGGAAFIGWQIIESMSAPPNMFFPPAIGASGAVMATMVLFCFHYPHRKILLFFVIPVPVWLLVVFYVAQDAFSLLGRIDTNVAVACHLGGALFGFTYYRQQWRLLDVWSSFRGLAPRRAKPRLRIYREEPEMSAMPAMTAGAGSDEQLEAKLDAVLEKVARSGKESLTETENEILLRASEFYKRRRT
ncbi:MAG: rhomboid family intramembrane serine protease [Gemmataceae bacterium]